MNHKVQPCVGNDPMNLRYEQTAAAVTVVDDWVIEYYNMKVMKAIQLHVNGIKALAFVVSRSHQKNKKKNSLHEVNVR